MIRLAALSVLLVFSAVAQPSNAPPTDRRVVEVKNLRGPRLEQAIKLLTTFLLPGDASSYPELNAVVLRGTPEGVAAAETMLRKFDVPVTAPARDDSRMPSSWQVRIYMVHGLAADPGGQVPAEIGTAVEQMKKNFQYQGYKLLETVVLQGQSGRGATVEGLLPNPEFAGTVYNAGVRQLVPADEGKTLHLTGFAVNIRMPFKTSYATASIQTDLTIRPGQKLVVGKLSAEQNGNAIFLIITAEPVS